MCVSVFEITVYFCIFMLTLESKFLSFLFLFLKHSCAFLFPSPQTPHLKCAEIIASDFVMTSLKCHTLVFASNCLFILPSELTGHALAYAFVYDNDFQFIEWSHHR